MLSHAEEQALVSLCDQFINSGEDGIGLPALLDHVNSTICDRNSQEWKAWTKHVDDLNKAWREIRKEGKDIAWPTVFTFLLWCIKT
jgi:hypothetical protein